MRAAVIQALKRGGWAPVAVLLFHQLCIKTGWRAHTDWLLHFLGGAAIAFLLHHFFLAAAPGSKRWLHLVQTFCAAATVALFWDIAEFTSDEILSTDIQHSLRETMLDLCFGVAGATLVSIAICLGTRRA